MNLNSLMESVLHLTAFPHFTNATFFGSHLHYLEENSTGISIQDS